jgi:PST family polysaccharide transporter
MRLSLIVATYGRDAELHSLLRSLVEQTFRDFEVIVVDQNTDDRVTKVLEHYQLPIRHLRTVKGHSRAFNAGLACITGDVVAFPDDDCWYAPDVLERVVRFFEANPSLDGLTGREWVETGFTSGFRWDREPGPVTPGNVWRRAITFSMFLRRSIVQGQAFDESLGVGAGSPWGAGEETDYLLRAIARGHSIHYDPTLGVWHRGRSGPYSAEIYEKARCYGCGIGRVLRIHRAPAHNVATHLFRPLAGTLLFLGLRQTERAGYHWSIFRGRLSGWTANPGIPALPPAPELVRQPAQGKSAMKHLAALSRNQLVHNTAALYGVQVGRKLVPLIILPFLARTLGAAGWGMVAFAQSLGEFIVLVIEFGFNLSATRAIARNRKSKEECSKIVAGVLGAQVLLTILAGGSALLVSRWIPLLHDHPKLLGAGLFYAVAQGFMPLWFFQGLERLRLAAALEVTGKLLGMGAILLLVRKPEDGWIALFVQGVAPALSTTAGIMMAYRAIPFRWPSRRLVSDAVRSGWRMFVFRSGESLFGVGNAFVLGLFAPPALVGYFASGEKISRAVFGLLNPIRDALYPRISSILSDAPEKAARLTRIGAIATISGGVILGGSMLAFAPLMIRILMGQGFSPAVTVTRILALLPPLLAVTHSVGLQWLLPRGQDAVVNRIILSAAVLNIVLAILLAPRFAHLGMAWAVVCSEAFVCFWMVRTVLRRGTQSRNSTLVAQPCEVSN